MIALISRWTQTATKRSWRASDAVTEPRSPFLHGVTQPFPPRWQPVAKFRTWLTRIVINLCLDRKRRAPWVALEAAGELTDPVRDPAAQYESDERERLLAGAIGQLPIRQRAAIVLVYREGMSHAEAAEILETTVSAVETLLARGKTALRRALKDDGE